ncbi:MAG: YitT family protein [Schwartzia sp.]|nr:YitT family protein [Schwartzia sp. (in: firmicutes)]
MRSSRFGDALGIVLGCLISSCSINLFLLPNHLLSGGLTGIGMIAYFLFGLPVGAQVLVYNVPLLIAALRMLGKDYFVGVLFGTVMFSGCLDATHFLNAYAPVPDPMLAAIFGGVFNGIGYGIIFRSNGSSGGLDIVAAIVKKYYAVNMGVVIFAFNCVIMGVSAFMFGMMPAMYTLISMFMSAQLTDRVVAGFNHRKVVILISDETERIAEAIIRGIGRGVTFLEGEGAFTHQEKRVLFVVVTLTQVALVKRVADHYDRQAFMIVLDANEVMGRGFTLPGVKLEKMLRERDAKARRERQGRRELDG